MMCAPLSLAVALSSVWAFFGAMEITTVVVNMVTRVPNSPLWTILNPEQQAQLFGMVVANRLMDVSWGFAAILAFVVLRRRLRQR